MMTTKSRRIHLRLDVLAYLLWMVSIGYLAVTRK